MAYLALPNYIRNSIKLNGIAHTYIGRAYNEDLFSQARSQDIVLVLFLICMGHHNCRSPDLSL